MDWKTDEMCATICFGALEAGALDTNGTLETMDYWSIGHQLEHQSFGQHGKRKKVLISIGRQMRYVFTSLPQDHSLLSWKWHRRRTCEQVSESSLQDTRLRHCTRGENPEKDFHSFLLKLHCLQTMETKNKIIGRGVQHTAASCFCGQLTICKVCCRQWSRFGANNSETSQPA